MGVSKRCLKTQFGAGSLGYGEPQVTPGYHSRVPLFLMPLHDKTNRSDTLDEPLHMIVGCSRGLGSALLVSSLDRNVPIYAVSRSDIRAPLSGSTRSLVTFSRCDLESHESLSCLKADIRRHAVKIDRITFCQRYRPADDGSEWDHALSAFKVETLATSEIITEISKSKGANRISVVICSSYNAYLVNRHLSLWYHISKASNRQLLGYFSATLEARGIYLSVVELGSFTRSENVVSERKRPLLQQLHDKSEGGKLPTEEDVVHIIELIHHSQLNGLHNQIYRYDGGLSNLSPEQLLDDSRSVY
jgi:NAD(P)-dependent dehydrogenase (short-subunit alcohol dehydrogenase family)